MLVCNEDGLLPQQLKLVVDFIDENLGQRIKLADVASQIHLSQYHFSRAFKRSLGISPHQYIIQQRLERAKHLLKQSDLAISEIAVICGFTDHSHLNNKFKDLTGTTPRNFRNDQ